MFVDHVLTPITLDALIDALDRGGHTALGTCPGVDRVSLAVAQLVEEHGWNEARDGLHGVWGNNLGNLDATAEEQADPSLVLFRTVRENEGSGGKTWTAVHVRRAFESVEDGAAYYWQALETRYLDAFVAINNGPRAFVRALKACRYFTGDEDAYATSVAWLMAKAERVIAARGCL